MAIAGPGMAKAKSTRLNAGGKRYKGIRKRQGGGLFEKKIT